MEMGQIPAWNARSVLPPQTFKGPPHLPVLVLHLIYLQAPLGASKTL